MSGKSGDRPNQQSGQGNRRQQPQQRQQPQPQRPQQSQPQQPQSQQAKGRRPPAGGTGGGGNGESIINAVQRPGPKNYVKGIASIMAVMGVLLGIGVILIAEIGGRSLFPGIIQEFSGAQEVDEAVTFTHEITLAYVANELAIFLAFMMAPLFGAFVALRMTDTREAKLGAAAFGVGIGTLIFVSVVVFASSIAVPALPDTLGQEAAVGGTTPEAQIAEGLDLGSVNFGNLLMNSVMIAIPAGLAAAATVFFSEKFFN